MKRCRDCGNDKDACCGGSLVDGLCVSCWCEDQDRREGASYRYWLTNRQGIRVEVTREAFVQAERDAGFVNTMAHPDRPATSGFSDGTTKGEVVRVVDEPV